MLFGLAAPAFAGRADGLGVRSRRVARRRGRDHGTGFRSPRHVERLRFSRRHRSTRLPRWSPSRTPRSGPTSAALGVTVHYTFSGTHPTEQRGRTSLSTGTTGTGGLCADHRLVHTTVVGSVVTIRGRPLVRARTSLGLAAEVACSSSAATGRTPDGKPSEAHHPESELRRHSGTCPCRPGCADGPIAGDHATPPPRSQHHAASRRRRRTAFRLGATTHARSVSFKSEATVRPWGRQVDRGPRLSPTAWRPFRSRSSARPRVAGRRGKDDHH
jgi:hypothetical protein